MSDGGRNQQLQAIQKIGVETEKMMELLKKDSLNAVKKLQIITTLCTDHNLEAVYIEKVAEKLVKYFSQASIFKRRKMALRISRLPLTTKIIICRAFLAQGIENFPMELMLIQETRKAGVKIKATGFKKTECEFAMALGNNAWGRLGIGSDVDHISELTPVKLPGNVRHIEMGQFHTIFVLTNGELYGCGKAANFLEGNHEAEEIIATPVKLDYFKCRPKVNHEIVLTDASTKITGYTEDSSLIIGKYTPTENIRILSSGENWTIINKLRLAENREAEEHKNRKITVDVHDGTRRELIVRPDCTWFGKDNEKQGIVFLLDGFRVNSEHLWKNYFYTDDGVAYAMFDKNMYKGKLIIVPRVADHSGDDSSDEEEDGDIQVADALIERKGDVLLCVMEEIVAPFEFGTMKMTTCGESIIRYRKHEPDNKRESDKNLNILPQFRVGMMPTELKYPQDSEVTCSTQQLQAVHEKLLDQWPIKKISELYTMHGLARSTVLPRILLSLIHFLRLNENGLPKVFVENINDEYTLDVNAIRKEMHTAFKMGLKIPVMVVGTDWTSAQSEKRELEVKKKCRAYILGLMDTVSDLLKKLGQIPLKYRLNQLDAKFGYFVKQIVENNFDVEKANSGIFAIPRGMHNFKWNHCEESMKDRITENDVDGSEERLHLIRVEALPVQDKNTSYREHMIYWTLTTRFHISCIDPKLLEHIVDGNVINLNMVCINDENTQRYNDYLDAFFIINDSDLQLQSFDRNIDIKSVTATLLAKDKYTIETSDGIRLEVPKVLFEIYSGYDGARKRTSVMTTELMDEFKLDHTAEAVELALQCLVDVRVFYNATMDLKIQVFELFEYCMITRLRCELLRMIVITAEESDCEFLRPLILHKWDEMLALIVNLRPEILIFWKSLPLKRSYLHQLNMFSELISTRRYDMLSPLASSPIEHLYNTCEFEAENEKINQKFMSKFMSKDAQDRDVQWDLMKLILSWDNKDKRAAKRPGDSLNVNFTGMRPRRPRIEHLAEAVRIELLRAA
ncbi:hypothetical protein L3Y34_009241 [Caenorhabditis briggsae]|uniref:Uncharacterized protein n=1 Tax=Caenorhabditis briggsae TaxID=6238 RepID=A0AAE9A260_CAEBR|nr:hypothetical protein L3Y34_009241 [Caenorhabditis briggsae]